MRSWIRIFLSVFVLIISGTITFPQAKIALTGEEKAWLSEHPVIDFFLDDQSAPYEYRDEYGTAAGIMPDLLDVIEQRLGIRFRRILIQFGAEQEQMSKGNRLASGIWALQGIDPKWPYNHTITIVKGYLSLFGKTSSDQKMDISQLRDKTIAMILGINSEMEERLGEHNKVLSMGSTQELIGSVLSGHADYLMHYREIVKFNLRQSQATGIHELHTFSEPDDGVILVRNSDPLLVSILNKSISDIADKELPLILSKWYGRVVKEYSSISETHRAWLEEHKSIKIGVSPSFAPFQYWDSEGKYSGMVSDFVRLLSEQLEISMDPVPNLTWAQIVSAAYERRIDVVPGIVKTPERAEKLLFTEPFLSLPVVVIANENFKSILNINDLEGARIAIIERTVQESYLNKDLAYFDPVYVENISEAMRAVSEGKADVMMYNITTFEFAQRQLGITNLRVAATTPYNFDLAIAVRKDWPELVHILQIALSNLSDSEKSLIYEKWTNIQIKREIDWVKMALWGSGLLIISLTIVGFIINSNRKLSKEIKFRKKTAEELKNARQAAEKALGDLKDTQTQLIQSEKMASLGLLSAGIAHEINNPINFVSVGSVSMANDLKELMRLLEKYEELGNAKDAIKLKEEINDLKTEIDYDFIKENLPQTVEDIITGAKRTTEIVKGLSNFSRIDAEDQIMADLHEGLDSSITLLQHELKNKVTVIKDYDDSIDKIPCYPGQLNQVFMNILKNAVDAIDDMGEIIIKTEKRAADVEISIKDNGSGMSKEVRTKIFDPFFTTKDVGKGTGLGLAVSYGIIKKHRGTIEVESREGEGSEFVIMLPMESLM